MQPIAALGEESLIVRAAIVGKRELMMFPLMVAIEQRYFRIDSIAEVDAMGEVLRRGQYELAECQIAGIEVQRSRLGMPALFGIFTFPAVGFVFYLGQPLRIEGIGEGPKTLFQA